MAHDIQLLCGAAIHRGVERESTVLIVGQKSCVVEKVTRNVGAIQGDVALGADRRVEELDIERPVRRHDVRCALRPGRRARVEGAEKDG